MQRQKRRDFESIKETFTPDRSVGLGERATSFKDAFSPTAIKNRAIASSGEAYQPAYDAVFSATQDTAAAQAAGLKAMEAAASPSLLSQYGPLAGAGAGIMALSGGFDTPQPEAPAGFEDFMAGGGQRLLEENPEKYGLRFGGIQPLSSLYTNYAPPTPTYNAAKGSGPKGVAPIIFPE